MSRRRAIGRTGFVTGLAPRQALLALLCPIAMAACSNVVPPEVENRIADQRAAEAERLRAQRELWVLDTDKGRIVVRLSPEDARRSVSQLRAWTRAGAYDGTWFHRVVRKPRPFVIQGGDPETRAWSPPATAQARLALAEQFGFGTTEPALAPENSRRRHRIGAVSLAVDEDGTRAGPQFVIALADLPHLDDMAPVIGQVVGGWRVVEALEIGDRVLRAQLLPPERIDGDWLRDLPPGDPTP